MPRLAPLVAPLLVVALSVVACKRTEEPDGKKPSTIGSTSSSSVASAAPSTSASQAPYTPREIREMREHLHNEMCNEAAKKKNQVNGLPDYDKKGTLVLGMCLSWGNTAWYRCILESTTAASYDACSKRYLIPPEEVGTTPAQK